MGDIIPRRRFLRGPHGWHAGLLVVTTHGGGHIDFVAAGDRLSILPDRDRDASSVPLWKVIVGSRADELEPDPQGSGFSMTQPLFPTTLCRRGFAHRWNNPDCASGTSCQTLPPGREANAPQPVAPEAFMTHRFAPIGVVVLSSAAFALTLTALSAIAQQPQDGPAPADITNRIRGLAQPPAPPAEDKLPTSALKLPQGFKVETYIHGVMDARSLRLGDKGTVFVGNRTGDKVYAVVSQGAKREAKVIASGLDRPNGLAFKDGTLYIAEGTKVSKLEKIEDNLDKPPQPVVIYSDFPDHRSHGWKFMAIGPDNKLYIPIGAPCNICEPPATNAQIRRYNLDGTGMEVVAVGVRNSVGFDFHPQTGELWFTDNGRDWAGDEGPQDELNRVSKARENFGFPYCHALGIGDPDLKKANPCDGVTLPVVLMGPHVAALGMRFYTGDMFPPEYKNSIFVARHGSWNRTQKAGYDVVVVNASPDGRNAQVTPFMTGFLDT